LEEGFGKENCTELQNKLTILFVTLNKYDKCLKVPHIFQNMPQSSNILGVLVTDQNYIHEDGKNKLNLQNAFCHSV